MEDLVEYNTAAPEVAESAEATPEVNTGEAELSTQTEQVEISEPTAPEETKIPLKAVQEERRKRQEMKEEAEFWRKVALGEIENPHKPAATTEKPTPDKFEDYDAYVEALADYKAEQVFLRQQEQTRKLTKEDIAKREETKLMDKVAKDAEAAAKKYNDFYEVAQTVVLPKPALEAIYQSDLGTEITYYLGKNPAEFDRIAELSPARQVMELGKLEVKLAAKTATPEAKRTKAPTQVESAGNGFQPPKVNLQQLRAQAMASGNWAQYLEAAGFVP